MELLPNVDRLKELAFAGQFEYVMDRDSDTIDNADGETDEVVLAEVYALEVYREEIRRAELLMLDEAVAMSFHSKDEHRLLNPDTSDLDSYSEDEGFVLVVDDEEESKPPPNCTCCCTPVQNESNRRILSCGHLYCTKCIATRCRMGVRDRSMVPAHCCQREFPSDYVVEVLNATELVTYERFLNEKPWSTLDLESDREYANVVQLNHAVQCPGCGVGVQKVSGCNHMTCLNGHQFCFLCTKKWKTCGCYN
uniref:RING-type domain-containing protein n=1 Tax=Hyaloperonospora arabidopsidis (strain Emoy2) TaxID=559515 RepID=M4C3U0_HYAAE